jgi:putative proteasome-type protease
LTIVVTFIAKIRTLWEKSVRQAFEAMPDIEWQQESTELEEDVLID